MPLRQLCVVAFILCSALCRAPVRADAPDPNRSAAARAAFEEGVQKADARAWEEAEALFRAALSLRESPVIRFNLSAVLAERGKLVEASGLLDDIVHDAQANEDLRTRARVRSEAVRVRLARLAISVDGDATQARVTLDERVLDEAELGVPTPVDPGAHRVVLRVGARELDSRELTLTEGESAEVRVQAPAPAPMLVAPVALPETRPAPLRQDLPRTDEDPSKNRKKALWWGIGGVAVAVVAGVVTGMVLAHRKSADRGESADAFDPPRVGVRVPQ